MHISPNTNVLFHQYGEEAVLLNLDTESYFSLNESAIRMWELLSAHSLEEASEAMAKEYDAPVEVISADMQAFVQALQQANLISVSDA
jgi:hypothetical protein